MSDAFEQIMAGARDALAFAKGERDGFVVHYPTDIDVKAIRQRLKLSQPRFAALFGFSVGRIRDWEQGRTEVDAPSRILLTVIDREPEAVMRALGIAPERKVAARKAKAA